MIYICTGCNRKYKTNDFFITYFYLLPRIVYFREQIFNLLGIFLDE